MRKNTAINTPFRIATVITIQSYVRESLNLNSGLNMVLTLIDVYCKAWSTFMLGNDFRNSFAG